MSMSTKRIIVGISGASGSIIGIRLLEELRKHDVETHLVITDGAKLILEHETNYKLGDVEKLASHVYDNKDFFAAIASGSFKIDAMVVVPCSMKTIAGIANGFSENLLLRAADVFLKERKKIILVPRETPLSPIHVENIYKASSAGAIILPAMISLYSKPKNIDDIVNHIVGKILDMLDIDNDIYKRWKQ
jgi:flavin prenyltransferase